jgi:hypothetical protein
MLPNVQIMALRTENSATSGMALRSVSARGSLSDSAPKRERKAGGARRAPGESRISDFSRETALSFRTLEPGGLRRIFLGLSHRSCVSSRHKKTTRSGVAVGRFVGCPTGSGRGLLFVQEVVLKSKEANQAVQIFGAVVAFIGLNQFQVEDEGQRVCHTKLNAATR